jgi:hypothetical protein
MLKIQQIVADLFGRDDRSISVGNRHRESIRTKY